MASILDKSKLFDVQEKCLRQVLKGVKYQSRSQQKQQRDHASATFTPSQFQKEDWYSDTLTSESSSSSDDGAKALKRKHHKKSKSK